MDNEINTKDFLTDYLRKKMNADNASDLQALKAQQDAEAERQANIGMLEGAVGLGQAGIGSSKVGVDYDTARQNSKAQLDNYLKQQAAKRQAEQDSFGVARDDARWKDEMSLKNRIANQKQPPREPVTPFEKAKDQAQAKKFVEVQNRAEAAALGTEAIDSAINSFETYTRNKVGGTGLIATLGGLKKYIDQDTELLDTKFKDQALTKLVTMFQGLSKTVDSNAERAAFNAVVPNIAKDDRTNRERLYGLKAAGLRAKTEAEAQQAWVDTYNNMDGYISPNNKLTTVVSPTGEMELIPKGSTKRGYVPLDDFIKSDGRLPSAPKQRPMLSPEKLNRYNELTAKRDAGTIEK
jgi:hypothetical protein